MRTWATSSIPKPLADARGSDRSHDHKGVVPHGERGFAMLLVFLMASMIAISLYMEIPRVAMQTQAGANTDLLVAGAVDCAD